MGLGLNQNDPLECDTSISINLYQMVISDHLISKHIYYIWIPHPYLGCNTTPLGFSKQ